MQSHSIQTTKSPGGMRSLFLVCVALIAVVSAANFVSAIVPCNVHRLEVPDPSDLKLKDGEHVLAAVDTEKGKFEARVNVKDKIASKPQFFIGGRLLRQVPEAEIPQPIRECVQNGGEDSRRSESEFPNLSQAADSRILATAPAPYRIRCTAVANCAPQSDGKYLCAVKVCCSGAGCEWDVTYY